MFRKTSLALLGAAIVASCEAPKTESTIYGRPDHLYSEMTTVETPKPTTPSPSYAPTLRQVRDGVYGSSSRVSGYHPEEIRGMRLDNQLKEQMIFDMGLDGLYRSGDIFNQSMQNALKGFGDQNKSLNATIDRFGNRLGSATNQLGRSIQHQRRQR